MKHVLVLAPGDNAVFHWQQPDGRPTISEVVTMPAAALMEALGRAGITISVCCGPCGASQFRWTVQCLARNGQEFDRPFAAESFDHAIVIAGIECAARGWITR